MIDRQINTNQSVNEVEVKRRIKELIYYNKTKELDAFIKTYNINVNAPLDMVNYYYSDNFLEWDDPSSFFSSK